MADWISTLLGVVTYVIKTLLIHHGLANFLIFPSPLGWVHLTLDHVSDKVSGMFRRRKSAFALHCITYTQVCFTLVTLLNPCLFKISLKFKIATRCHMGQDVYPNNNLKTQIQAMRGTPDVTTIVKRLYTCPSLLEQVPGKLKIEGEAVYVSFKSCYRENIKKVVILTDIWPTPWAISCDLDPKIIQIGALRFQRSGNFQFWVAP